MSLGPETREPATPATEPAPRLVDWGTVGRRLRLTAVILLGLAVAAWVLVGALRGRVHPADLWDYLGLALVGMFVAELVVVGGSAIGGLLRAGERGERLAREDVGMLPPQLLRRRAGTEDVDG